MKKGGLFLLLIDIDKRRERSSQRSAKASIKELEIYDAK